MMGDLENYKVKAEMSKELATYFSPFTSINQYTKEQLFREAQTKRGVIDVKQAMRSEDSKRIADLEQRVTELETENARIPKLEADLKKEMNDTFKLRETAQQNEVKYKEMAFKLEEQSKFAEDARKKL